MTLYQSPEEVIMNDTLLMEPRVARSNVKAWFVIPQLQWLGFPYGRRHDVKAIQSYITEIISK